MSEATCCALGYSSASLPVSCTTTGGYKPTELAGLLKLRTPAPRPPSWEDNLNLVTDSFSTSDNDFASAVSLFGDLDGGGGEELDRMERRLREAPRLMACAADSKSEWGSVEELPLVPCEASL
jgi:hypothetical protein